MSDKIRELLNRIVPRLDAGGPNPIAPELHHCEWVLYRERERIHAEFAAALAQQPTTVAVPDERHPVGGLDHGWKGEYNRGWNDCRVAMLAATTAAPEPFSTAKQVLNEQEPRLKVRTKAIQTRTMSGAVAWLDGPRGVILYDTETEAQAAADAADQRKAKAMFDALDFSAPPAAEQPDTVMVSRMKLERMANDIAYAVFNLANKKLSSLRPGLVETSNPADTALIVERDLRRLLAGGEA